MVAQSPTSKSSPASQNKPTGSNSNTPDGDANALQKLSQYFSHVKDRLHLKHRRASKWLEKNKLQVHELREASQQVLAATSLAGAVAMNASVNANVVQRLQQQDDIKIDDTLLSVTADEYESVIQKLQEYVSRPPGHLEQEEELYLEQQLTDLLGFDVTAELEGNRLNHSYGIMGGEQHLPRFPGDTLAQHDAFQEAGITQNRGAFGWFTQDGLLTDKAIQQEKYYFAVQTLYLPNWNTEYKTLKPWYAYRKMIMINPYERIAVVGVVGDAGPAQWVNKQFGGSPEVIREGKVWSKEARGRVLLYFVDDPEDSIPLGVIQLDQYQEQVLASLEAAK